MEARAVTLSPDQFCAAFPFFLHWDFTGRLLAAGASARRLFPELEKGSDVTAWFTSDSGLPLGGREESVRLVNELLILRCAAPEVTLRGQAVAAADGSGLLYLCTPWLASPSHLARLGLSLADFAVHDSGLDQLYLVEAGRNAAATDNGVLITDASGTIEWVNAAFARLTGLLVRAPLMPAQAELVRIICSSGEALSAVVDDVLDLAKIETEKDVMVDEDFALLPLVESACAIVAPQAASRGLDLATIQASTLPAVVRGDPGRIRQVLLNLLENSVKFTAHGEVAVTVSARDDLLILDVSDTGPGIPADQIPGLFQSSVQLRSLNPERGGTGLGLAICRRLVTLMGGEVDVTSEPGRGSRFRVTLPLRPSNALGGSSAAGSEDRLSLLLCASPGATRAALTGAVSTHCAVTTSEASAARVELREGAFDVVLIDGRLGDPTHIALAGDALAAGTKVLWVGRWPDSDAAVQPSRLTCLSWPVAPTQVQQHLRGMEAAVPRRRENPAELRTLGPRVLVADDNEVNARLATLMLEKLGYRSEIVVDGQRAVERWRQGGFAAVLMDCQMPAMDGYEATRRIRALEQEANAGEPVRIIAMTANITTGEPERCRSCGMDDYLGKPIRLATMQRSLAVLGDAEDWPLREAIEELIGELGEGCAAEIMALWMHDAPERAADLAALAGGPEQVTVRRLAHSMKSSSAILGLRGLQKDCAELERVAGERQLAGQAELASASGVRVNRTMPIIREQVVELRTKEAAG